MVIIDVIVWLGCYLSNYAMHVPQWKFFKSPSGYACLDEETRVEAVLTPCVALSSLVLINI